MIRTKLQIIVPQAGGPWTSSVVWMLDSFMSFESPESGHDAISCVPIKLLVPGLFQIILHVYGKNGLCIQYSTSQFSNQ